jgi:hypothetical protein
VRVKMRVRVNGGEEELQPFGLGCLEESYLWVRVRVRVRTGLPEGEEKS